MNPNQSVLLERIRALIANEPVMREVSMFGSRAVMVNERMAMSALKDGGLLIRVDATQHDKLLSRPGAMPAKMGPGRDMGPGWIEVTAEAISDDQHLVNWVGIAMDYNRAVTGGQP